jgi:hypothetical protein
MYQSAVSLYPPCSVRHFTIFETRTYQRNARNPPASVSETRFFLATRFYILQLDRPRVHYGVCIIPKGEQSSTEQAGPKASAKTDIDDLKVLNVMDLNSRLALGPDVVFPCS